MSAEKCLQKNANPTQQPPTPSLTKRKKIQEINVFRSPTDNMVSPCTRRLLKKTDKVVNPRKTLPDVPKFTVEDKENASVM
ncbi:hypothetical protein AOXY_G10201 [Acipenser oxyrinchus oxyrinchus]|uniref:Uncharacterized protein n=1 Tax=Acipenser oxyrinchus oxyrinchus TaxID=40147 RepID=A0AAD8G5X9_ACIOX|nr:hypothetical protein AOXY_G10201 [Acipenser oxyrinchus oxyrinchus]